MTLQGVAWQGRAWLRMARHGLVGLGKVRQGKGTSMALGAWAGSIPARHYRRKALRGKALLGGAVPGVAWLGVAWHGEAMLGAAMQG